MQRPGRDRQHPAVGPRDQLGIGERQPADRERAVREQQRRTRSHRGCRSTRRSGESLVKRPAPDDVEERQPRRLAAPARRAQLADAAACTASAGARSRSRTQRASPSTPPRLTNAPPKFCCRKSETPNGRPGTIDVSARLASESSRDTGTDACAGTPLHTTCSDDCDGPIRASSRRHGAIAHRRAAADREGEHRRTRGDPERDERGAPRRRTQTDECEPDRIRRAPETRAVHARDRSPRRDLPRQALSADAVRWHTRRRDADFRVRFRGAASGTRGAS